MVFMCSVKLCHVLKLLFTRRSCRWSSLFRATMVGAVPADKQARAALHHFSKWYADAVDDMTFAALPVYYAEMP